MTPEMEKVIDEIVDYINSKINLPLLNESQERTVFKSMLMALFRLLGGKVQA